MADNMEEMVEQIRLLIELANVQAATTAAQSAAANAAAAASIPGPQNIQPPGVLAPPVYALLPGFAITRVLDYNSDKDRKILQVQPHLYQIRSTLHRIDRKSVV